MNTLIIGANTGGIGDEVFQEIIDRWKTFSAEKVESGHILTPTREEFDVSSRHSVSRWFAHQAKGMVFDQVIYCAGFNQIGTIGDLDKVYIREMFDVNALGFIRVLDHLVMHQGKQIHPSWDRDGHAYNAPTCSIVAIVSNSATTPMRRSIGYASSQAALAQAIRCSAKELAPSYRINGISISTVENTSMTRYLDRVTPEEWKKEESLPPMDRRVTKEEVAELTVNVLAGPDFLTGAIIPLTGGE